LGKASEIVPIVREQIANTVYLHGSDDIGIVYLLACDCHTSYEVFQSSHPRPRIFDHGKFTLEGLEVLEDVR